MKIGNKICEREKCHYAHSEGDFQYKAEELRIIASKHNDQL